jgi:hypothetical protein
MKKKLPTKNQIIEKAFELLCVSNASAFGGSPADIESFFIKKAGLELNK